MSLAYRLASIKAFSFLKFNIPSIIYPLKMGNSSIIAVSLNINNNTKSVSNMTVHIIDNPILFREINKDNTVIPVIIENDIEPIQCSKYS